MGALRTIVATAVIVFTLTTVAMAGVQHFTTQSGQTALQTPQQPSYTVSLTDKQLVKLLAAGKQVATHTTKHVQQRHAEKQSVRHTYASTRTANYGTSQGPAGGTGYRSGNRCNSYNNNCWDHNGGGSGSHSGGGECCR